MMTKKENVSIAHQQKIFENVKKAMPSTIVMLFLDKDTNKSNNAQCNVKEISGISKDHRIKYSLPSGLEFSTNKQNY